MVNVVTYCRVSSEEQALKDLSIPAQRKQLVRWVGERPDHRVVAEFADEGESAYAPASKRPGFCEMVAYCRKHKVNAILVHKLDRFSRNQEESILFKGLLRKNGVTVKSATEVFDPETPSGFLYEGMIEVINQFYSMNLATETLKGMKENAERGWVNGGRIPFGYRVQKVADAKGREHGELVFADAKEVQIVRDIFEMGALKGMGVKAIANELNKNGVPAPRGRHWSGSTLDCILNNRAYIGECVWFKSRKQGREGRERTAEKERIVVENAHPAIVERELFDRRQAIAAERRFDAHTSPSRPVSYLLSRLMVCGNCGHHFGGRRIVQKSADGTKVERFAYYCGGYLNNGKHVCTSLPIPKQWLETTILKIIRARLCEPDGLADLEKRVRDRVEAERRALGSDSRVIEAKIADLDRRIDNYFRAIGDGLDPARCKASIAELTAEKEKVEADVTLVRNEGAFKKAIERNLTLLRQFATIFRERFESVPFRLQREVILHFIQKVDVRDRRVIDIHFKVPFDPDGVKFLADELVMPHSTTAGGGETKDAAKGEGVPSFLSGPARGAILDRRRSIRRLRRLSLLRRRWIRQVHRRVSST
jgi:DNA invertase Pin-like site-specific DNA recombinase